MSGEERDGSSIVHGGLDIAELRQLGLAATDVVDFSASINPLGPPAGVREAIAEVDPATYPDRDCLELREALAIRWSTGVDRILVGNGSTEVIHLLARAALKHGDSAVVLSPSFGEYEAASVRAGAVVHRFVAEEADAFAWDLAAAARTIRQQRAGVTFVCNPNNPTGVLLDPDAIRGLARAADDGLLVVDGAYMDLADDPWDEGVLHDLRNVVVLRSMTKDFALAGIRLGYLVGSPEVIARIAWLQASWSVSAVAQAAGLAALGSADDYLVDARILIRAEKAYLRQGLSGVGLRVMPSAANFLLIEVGDAAEVRRALLTRGVAVRDCSSFGLPQFIRIGIRRRDENQRLIDALERVVADG